MSDLKKMGTLLLASALLTTMGTGCGGSTASGDTASGEEASGTSTISIVFKTTANEYTQYMMAGAQEAAEKYGVTLEMKGASSETSYDEQQNIIETDLSSGKYDAMIIAPLQGDMAATLVSGANIPIFAIDTDFDAEEKVSFIGIGQEDAAASGGEAAVAAAKEAGWTDIKAAYIAGVQGDSTAEARKSGFQKGIEAAGGTFLTDEIQYADAVADKAANCMEAIMQNHPDGIAIVCCHNDDCAMAAARTAEGNPAFENTIFVGFDGNVSAAQSILEGGETMTVAQSGYDQGYRAVETVVNYLSGEDVASFVDCGTQIVDGSSAQAYLDELKEQMGDSLNF